jgi:hypothetical protein
MIAVYHDIIHEVDIIGGTAALIRVTMWEPSNEEQYQFKIIAADYNSDILGEWSFQNETDAHDAFEDLSRKVA